MISFEGFGSINKTDTPEIQDNKTIIEKYDTTHEIGVIVLDSLNTIERDSLQQWLEKDTKRYLQAKKIAIKEDFINLYRYFHASDSSEFYQILNKSFPDKVTKKDAYFLLQLIQGNNYLTGEGDVQHLQWLLYNMHPILKETLIKNGGIDAMYGYATRQTVKKLTVSIEEIIQKELEEGYTQLYLNRYESFHTVFILIDESGSNKDNKKFPFQLTHYLKNYLERHYNVYIRKYGKDNQERGFLTAALILKEVQEKQFDIEDSTRLLIEIHTDEPDATGQRGKKFDIEEAIKVFYTLRKRCIYLNKKGNEIVISFALYQLRGNPDSGIVKLVKFEHKDIHTLVDDIDTPGNTKIINRILRKKQNRISKQWWWNLPVEQQFILELVY